MMRLMMKSGGAAFSSTVRTTARLRQPRISVSLGDNLLTMLRKNKHYLPVCPTCDRVKRLIPPRRQPRFRIRPRLKYAKH